MKIFPLDFLNLMADELQELPGVMLINFFSKIFSLFFKSRIECPFNFTLNFLIILHAAVFLTR